MRAQYPDHSQFESHSASGFITSTMQYMSNSVSLETASCVMYVLVLVYTAGQCVELVRWSVGTPIVVRASGPGSEKKCT